MREQGFPFLTRIPGMVAIVLLASIYAAAQTLAPTPTQTPNPPRTPDGQPDIQGYWVARGTTPGRIFPTYTLEGGHLFDKRHTSKAGVEIEQVANAMASRSVIVDPPSGKDPYQPWALAKRQEHFEAHLNPTKPEHIDGRARCYLPGAPRMTYSGAAQIVQNPGYVVFLIDYAHTPRIVPLDGRPHLSDKIRLWQGDARGRWEGNTLVVETINTNAKWLDIVGDFHSNAVRVVERFTVAGPDTIQDEATVDDPTVYTTPWKIGLTLRRNDEPGFELWEEACVEGQDSTANLFSAPSPARTDR